MKEIQNIKHKLLRPVDQKFLNAQYFCFMLLERRSFASVMRSIKDLPSLQERSDYFITELIPGRRIPSTISFITLRSTFVSAAERMIRSLYDKKMFLSGRQAYFP